LIPLKTTWAETKKAINHAHQKPQNQKQKNSSEHSRTIPAKYAFGAVFIYAF
jgi:hypothetical protein